MAGRRRAFLIGSNMYEHRRARLPIDAHRGKPADFAKRLDKGVRRLRKDRSVSFAEKCQQLEKHWHDPRNLFVSLQHIVRHGGKAVGPDGIRPEHLATDEWFQLFREIRPLLAGGTYRQGS